MEENEIPQYGRKGVAFLGVELAQGWPVIAAIFVGLPLGKLYWWVWYFAVPVGTFFVTKQYLEWMKNESDDFWTAFLYRFGLTSISPAFDKLQQIFIGDSVTAAPGHTEYLKDHLESNDHGTQDAN